MRGAFTNDSDSETPTLRINLNEHPIYLQFYSFYKNVNLTKHQQNFI
jgi:hypothetical protein